MVKGRALTLRLLYLGPWASPFAATANDAAIAKVSTNGVGCVAAVAATFPATILPMRVVESNDGQFAEPFAHDIHSGVRRSSESVDSLNGFNCALERPADFQATADSVDGQSKDFAPLRHGLGSPLVGNEAITAPIVSLLDASRPSHVPWLVIAIVIWVAVEACACWAWPHVGEEVRKTLVPSLADFNATTPVVFITSGFWVIAPLSHLNPCSVLGCLKTVVFGDGFSMNAAATRYPSRVQVSRRNDFGVSAITFTKPKVSYARTIRPTFRPSVFNYNQSPDSFSEQTDKSAVSRKLHNQSPLLLIVACETTPYKRCGIGG